jgi:hypothetical protein
MFQVLLVWAFTTLVIVSATIAGMQVIATW